MCSKCGTKMKVSRCAKAISIACVIIEDKENKEHRVTIFTDILNKIAEYSKVSSEMDNLDAAEQLMLTPQLEYTVNDKGTVVSISQVI